MAVPLAAYITRLLPEHGLALITKKRPDTCDKANLRTLVITVSMHGG